MKIHKVKIVMRDDRWDNVEIAQGEIEISVDGEINRNNIPEISSKKLQMFKDTTRLEIIIDNGEDKSVEE